MTRFIVHTTQSAPAASRPLLEGIERTFGFVPNLFSVFAESPAALGGALAIFEAFSKSSLSRTEQQLVMLAASEANDCGYCVAAHSTIAKRMVKVDPALVDPFLEKVNALRGRVSESTETVDAIRTRIQAVATGESLEERLGRLAQLTLRVVLTLGDIDARLGEVADGLVASRSRAQGMRERLGRYILLAEIGAFVLVAWMAVGQISLARYGWTKVRATKGRRKP